MAYSFSNSTAYDITTTGSNNMSGSTTLNIVAGWYAISTLTAGRYYWSTGNTAGLSVASTTSEVQLLCDATTDGVWTSSGAGLAINRWWFIAVAYTVFNTGPAMDCALWIGDDAGNLNQVTMTQTTGPGGTFTGSTSRTVGNRGTGTVSIQATVSDLTFILQNVTGTNPGRLQIATSGAITTDEEENIFRTVVQPLYRTGGIGRTLIGGATTELMVFDLNGVAAVRRTISTASANTGVAPPTAVNGENTDRNLLRSITPTCPPDPEQFVYNNYPLMRR